MKNRGLQYRDLADNLELSIPSVKRLLNSGDLTLDRIEHICEWLNTSFFELVELAKTDITPPSSFSLEQEKYLASNLQALIFFRSLVLNIPVSAIGDELKLNKLETSKILSKLEKVELIEVWPKNKIKMKITWPFQLIPNGPIQSRYEVQIPKTIVNHVVPSLSEDRHLQSFELMLLPESYSLMQSEFEALIRKYKGVARIENLRHPYTDLKQITGLTALDNFVVWKKFDSK